MLPQVEQQQVSFPAGSPGEGSRDEDHPGGGDGPQRSHRVSVSAIPLRSNFVLRMQRKNNLLTGVFMCINIYITRTDVIPLDHTGWSRSDSVHHPSQRSHLQPPPSVLQEGECDAWAEDHGLLLLRPCDVYFTSAMFSWFFQLVKRQHWYWCGPARLVSVSVIDFMFEHI